MHNSAHYFRNCAHKNFKSCAHFAHNLKFEFQTLNLSSNWIKFKLNRIESESNSNCLSSNLNRLNLNRLNSIRNLIKSNLNLTQFNSIWFVQNTRQKEYISDVNVLESTHNLWSKNLCNSDRSLRKLFSKIIWWFDGIGYTYDAMWLIIT